MVRGRRRLSATERGAVIGGGFAVCATIIASIIHLLKPDVDGIRVADADGIVVHVSAHVPDSIQVGSLSYRTRRDGHTVRLEPEWDYLYALEGSHEITEMPDDGTPAEPALDIKIVNNTQATIFITGAILCVAESRPDLMPVLQVSASQYDGKLSIHNDGWGEVRDSYVKYNLVPRGEPRESGHPFHQDLGTFQHSTSFNIMRALESKGVELSRLSRWQQNEIGLIVWLSDDEFRKLECEILGPFADGWARVYGEIFFRTEMLAGIPQRVSVAFAIDVGIKRDLRMKQPISGDRVLVSGQYGAVLQVEGSEYEVRIPLSQALKSGDYDRFVINLRTEKSSFHRLTLVLEYNDGEILTTEPMIIHSIVTRSHYRALLSAMDD